MTTSNPGVPVKYTGRETPFIDRLYGSSLPFNPGQTRVVTDLELAAKLLRHEDVFTRGEDSAPAPEPTKPEGDDTAALLKDADKNKKALQETENRRMDLVESLNAMDKDALQAFALEKFSQKVPKNLSVDNMRAKVVELLDQFGAP
ncbi:hypothetical protein [Variovorax sp. PMC12]|uniref:hypothetical protein n=1 Tax=Variovorax sp. PMC12 TaxID=2126319 RepID=UPI000D13310B|nr:hypothetical protein [Variovorax sp. PMC12]AVQ84288.1 hypothetical protein C4F17_26925 [Variovorax sp. PMC12]